MRWPVRRLEELAIPETGAIKIGPFGSQLKREELVDDGVHVVGIENVLARKFDGLGQRFITREKYHTLRSVEVRPGDVVITMMGTVGEVAVVPPETSTSIMDSHLLRFRPNLELCLPEFVAWFLRSPDAQVAVSNRAHGAIMKGLNSGIVRSLLIPLPPISEQRRIVKILDQADRLHRLRAEANAKADRILPALFIKMFGDPAANPMGWPVKPLGDLTEHLTSGSRGWSKYTGRGPAHFLRTQDINGGDIADDLLPIDPPDGAEAERTRLAVGDVAITITGIVGKAAVFHGHDRPVYISQHVALIRPKADELCSEYLAAYANLPVGDVPVLARFQYGQTKPGLGFQELRTARIPLAPLKLQRVFAQRVKAVQVSRHAGPAASRALAALWTTLLSRAFSGDLTEPWREAHMKDLLQEMEHQAKALTATARPE
jgi:type I restriction enzyme S subunit